MSGDVTGVALLGSTGSIGTQAIDVVEASGGRLRVVALAAHRSAAKLAAQARRLRPAAVALADPAEAAQLRRDLPPGVRCDVGPEAVAALAAADDVDVVLNAVTGSVGLLPTLTALDAGRRLALANKESLIVGGPLVTARARPGQILPVDSEHSALAQCLRGGRAEEVDRLVLTASGGPFRGRTRDELVRVTRDAALAHPTWAMGPVITVNSATLMNKGLEVIEAHLLFGVPYDRIDVAVHPQSLVHAMVAFRDGSTIAQVSRPDMRLPIALALGWPDRSEQAYGTIDWSRPVTMTFEPADRETFPLLDLAVAAGRRGGIAPAVLNAANEEAVDAFLAGRLPFLGIADVVAATLDVVAPAATVTGADMTTTSAGSVPPRGSTDALTGAGTHTPAASGTVPPATLTLDDVLAVEHAARAAARTLVDQTAPEATWTD